jgi:uncharacterized membrane protein YfcA
MPNVPGTAFLTVCPLVFLAGLIDSVAGGGGIISLPAYLLAGLPVHTALATNKFSSFCGTSIAAGRYIRHACYEKSLVLPTVAAALAGSAAGARLALLTDEKYLRYLLLAVLPVAAALVLFRKNAAAGNDGTAEPLSAGRFAIATGAALIIGMYDGYYGPGTGTFLMLVFTGFVKLDIRRAAGNTKCINWASNAAALATFIAGGRVLYPLGAAAAVCSIAGNYAGSGLVIKNGTKAVRPVIVLVLILLFVKILYTP